MWLLCSDGLHGMVDKERMTEMLKADDLDTAAQALLDAALDAGGKDNISLILIKDEEGVQ